MNDMHLDSFNDIWEINLSCDSIKRLETVSKKKPSGRCAASMAAVGNKLYFFGGLLQTFEFTNELWEFDLTTLTWTLLPCNGTIPQARWGHTMVAYESFLVIYGGSNPHAVLDDIWYLDTSASSSRSSSSSTCYTWKNIELAAHAPEGRSGHGVVMLGSNMYVYAGNTHGSTMSDLWKLDLKNLKNGKVITDHF